MAYFMTSFRFAELFLLTKWPILPLEIQLLEADGPGPRDCQDFWSFCQKGLRTGISAELRKEKKEKKEKHLCQQLLYDVL